MSTRPHLDAVFKARHALRWAGVAGPGSPLVGRAHPATLEAIILELVPEWGPPDRTRGGWSLLGIPFEDDDTLEVGLIVVEREPFVDAYREQEPRPRELAGVILETARSIRATVRVTL